jgi:hypothetical protein
MLLPFQRRAPAAHRPRTSGAPLAHRRRRLAPPPEPRRPTRYAHPSPRHDRLRTSPPDAVRHPDRAKAVASGGTGGRSDASDAGCGLERAARQRPLPPHTGTPRRPPQRRCEPGIFMATRRQAVAIVPAQSANPTRPDRPASRRHQLGCDAAPDGRRAPKRRCFPPRTRRAHGEGLSSQAVVMCYVMRLRTPRTNRAPAAHRPVRPAPPPGPDRRARIARSSRGAIRTFSLIVTVRPCETCPIAAQSH